MSSQFFHAKFKFTDRKCHADVNNKGFGVFSESGTRCKHGFYRIECVGKKLCSLLSRHSCRLGLPRWCGILPSANSAFERFGLLFFIYRVISLILELANFNRPIYRTNPFACQNKISYTHIVLPQRLINGYKSIRFAPNWNERTMSGILENEKNNLCPHLRSITPLCHHSLEVAQTRIH